MIVENEIILDKTDLSILRLMQENARITNADLARELNMAPSGVLERVKKLEQKNVSHQPNKQRKTHRDHIHRYAPFSKSTCKTNPNTNSRS